jgi:hypothetical protein
MVKFQQRYQTRSRILSKAVPALELGRFCNSQNCVPLVRQFLGFDSDRILQLFVLRNHTRRVLKLHILQECAEECWVFSARGDAGNGFAAARKRSIRRPPAKNGLGEAADHVPILSDGTLGANWRDMNRKRAGFKPSKDSLLLFLIPISHLVPLLEFNQP